jgi:hypothetical protein
MHLQELQKMEEELEPMKKKLQDFHDLPAVSILIVALCHSFPVEFDKSSLMLLFSATVYFSSSSFNQPKLNSEYYWQGSDRIHCACWFLACFHNLVTYTQRLQDLYSACLMF